MTMRIVALTCLLAAVFSPAWCDANTEETALIAALTSPDATVDAKVEACHRLKLIGTEQSLPALAACLVDERLSHPARQAIESMPYPKAGEVLLDALTKTAGLIHAGVIDSLGIRRELQAVAPLTSLLTDADPVLAAAAARSLGRIGTVDAAAALETNLDKAAPATQPVLVEGLLRAIDRLKIDGNEKQAHELAASLCKRELPYQYRVSAQYARMRTAGADELNEVIAGIQETDPDVKSAALKLASSLEDPNTTAALTKALIGIEPAVQIALLKALGQRGDKAASQGIMDVALNTADSNIQGAALYALGEIGAESAVPFLVKFAAEPKGTGQAVAREALAYLHQGDIHGALVNLLKQSDAPVQVEIIGTLAARNDMAAIPVLLDIASANTGEVQSAALDALSSLATDAEAPQLIEILSKAQTDDARKAAQNALVAVAGNSKQPAGIADALIALKAGIPATRIAALTAAIRIEPIRTLPAVRTALTDANPDIRLESLRMLAQYGGPEAISDLLTLANKAQDETTRTLALRGYWRLADLIASKTGGTPSERLERIKAGLAEARSPEDIRGGLSLLAGIITKEALEVAENAANNTAVKEEAELAEFQIASRLIYIDRVTSDAVIARLAGNAQNATLRENAANLTASLTQHADYIFPWRVSQPFRVEGKQASELFDLPLGPELPDGGGVVWNALPAPSDPVNAWMIDLSNAVGGDHCAIFLKTEVYQEKAGDVRLEMGSDDGIKLWVNGAIVHANNAIRGFAPNQESATVALKEGWNSFLVKISQHTLGCSMAIRVCPVDGSAGSPVMVRLN